MTVDGVSFTMPTPVSQPLLCKPCEDLLSRRGENEVLAQMWRREEGFRIRDSLLECYPALADSTNATVVQLPLSLQRLRLPLTHFALGIVWKAGVRDWQVGKQHVLRRLNLGEHEQSLRDVLLGKDLQLARACVLVDVILDSDARLAMSFPYLGGRGSFDLFVFSIPGLHFRVCLGLGIPESLRGLSLNSPTPFVGASRRIQLDPEGSVERALRTSVPKGKLARVV